MWRKTNVEYDSETKMIYIDIDRDVTIRLTEYEANVLAIQIQAAVEKSKQDKKKASTKDRQSIDYKAILDAQFDSHLSAGLFDMELKAVIEEYASEYSLKKSMDGHKTPEQYESLECGMAYEHGYDDGYAHGRNDREREKDGEGE